MHSPNRGRGGGADDVKRNVQVPRCPEGGCAQPNTFELGPTPVLQRKTYLGTAGAGVPGALAGRLSEGPAVPSRPSLGAQVWRRAGDGALGLEFGDGGKPLAG